MNNLAIDELANARMPFVRFERRAVEDVFATREAGRYVARDVDYALVTPPYSRDVMIHELPGFIEQLEFDARNDRVPITWVEQCKKAYEAFKNGQELPLDGTPIKGWGVISPAQQETLIRMHILTVESLAAITEEGVRRIGMGGIDLKTKANVWLKQLKKTGPATVEIAALKQENEQLKMNMERMELKIAGLMEMLKAQQYVEAPLGSSIISADDLLE